MDSNSGENDSLNGLKAVADYLDTSPRNVYRWEKEIGLPLRRLGGSKGRRVYALKSELDEWLEKRESLRPPTRAKAVKPILWGLAAAAGIIVIIIAVIILVLINLPGKGKTDNPTKYAPFAADFSGRKILISNKEGELLWSFTAAKQDSDEFIRKNYSFADFLDIDDDGLNEVVGGTYYPGDDKYFITLFDNDGSIIWERNIRTEVSYDKVKIGKNYRLGNVLFGVGRSGEIYVISLWVHIERFLSIIACHDIRGNLLYKYAHTGHTSQVKLHDLDGDGVDEIIVGATNNLLSGESVIYVLPLTGFHGVSPPYRVEPEYAHLEYRLRMYVPDDPDPGNQILYLRFGKTEYLRKYLTPYIFSFVKDFGDDVINIEISYWATARESVGYGFLYVVDGSFRLRYAIANAVLVKLYPDFLEEKAIDISLEELVRIYSDNIQRWEGGRWVPNPKRD